jgi:hypothetical protein
MTNWHAWHADQKSFLILSAFQLIGSVSLVNAQKYRNLKHLLLGLRLCRTVAAFRPLPRPVCFLELKRDRLLLLSESSPQCFAAFS